MRIRIRTVAVLLALLVLHGLKVPRSGSVLSAAPPHGKPGSPSGIGSLSVLPSLGGSSQALAVKWTLKQGAWTLTDLPWPPGASSVTARAVNNRGDGAGITYPGQISRAVLWPTGGGFTVLGCTTEVGPASVYGISASGPIIVGGAGGAASLWRPGVCRTALPPLVPGGYSSGHAINGDGTIVGGSAGVNDVSVPVRWRLLVGLWQIEQLDALSGTVMSANAVGDLAGSVYVSCALADGCPRAAIWYAAGGSQLLGTLGGDRSGATDINASGEVVGFSAPTMGSKFDTGFFWSESRGMVPLAPNGRDGVLAMALSDVRPDGTRLVVGADSRARAAVWVIANP